MTVYEKIRALRIKQGMSQEELAQKVGYSGRGTISKVELSERDISISMLPKYAEALGVTTEYLMSDEFPTDVSEEPSDAVSSTVASNLRYYRKIRGLTQKQLADMLGVTNTAVFNWEKGANSMGIDMLCSICAALDVSIDKMCSDSPHEPELTNRKTMSDRLKEIMDERNLRQVDILNLCQPYCELYGIRIDKSLLSFYLKGTVLPKSDKLMILALALDVNEAWLMGYDVPAERVDSKDSLVLSRLTDEEISLLLAYRKHPEMQIAIKTLLGMTK